MNSVSLGSGELGGFSRGSEQSSGSFRGVHEVPSGTAAISGNPSPVHEVLSGVKANSGGSSLVSDSESPASPDWQRYADIIDLAPHEPRSHQRMSRHDRAAQFAPYAPLTSFGKVLTDATLNDTVPGGNALTESEHKL